MNSHKPLTAGEIEEIKSLEAKATPGPWAWEFTGDDNTCAVGTVMDENDNFVAGMVDGDADTIVVDSVCREVTNQQDAAFIAAARNALPRLLSLLPPPSDAAVREAVEWLNDELRTAPVVGNKPLIWTCEADYLRTLLRAVQAPRMTGEQVSALITARRNLLAAECPVTVSLLAAVFPEAFAGEVGE